MATRVALIFGYGANIGNSVAAAFAAKGYKVAVVSRSGKSTHNDYLSIHADLTDPSSVEPVFSEVVDKLGHPSVVVYNRAWLFPGRFLTDSDHPQHQQTASRHRTQSASRSLPFSLTTMSILSRHTSQRALLRSLLLSWPRTLPEHSSTLATSSIS